MMSSLSISDDIRPRLQRSFECQIDEDSQDLVAWRSVGLGGGTNSYCDRIWFDLKGAPIPDYWRDNLRHELRKYPIIAGSLIFRDSETDASDRKAQLLKQLHHLPDFESLPESTRFLSVEFKLADRHEVTIMIGYGTPETSVPPKDGETS